MRFHNIPIRDIISEAVRYNGVIVDVRSNPEFLKGHIPMAINSPLEDIREGGYSLPKNKTLLVYCQHGGGSLMAAKILTTGGYHVINTVGGLDQYRGALTKER